MVLVPVYRLLGLVVRCQPQERKVPGLNPACARIFSGSSHTSDLNIGTPVATLPGAWHYRVSAGTGRPGVSILWLGEMESWICNFYLSVAARKIVQIRPWDTLACCWDVKQPTNKQTNSACFVVLVLHSFKVVLVKWWFHYQLLPWDKIWLIER